MEASTRWSNTDMKWRNMTVTQKLVFCGKFVVGLCTFGFAFPNLFDEE